MTRTVINLILFVSFINHKSYLLNNTPNELQWYVYTVILIRERKKPLQRQCKSNDNYVEEMLSNKMKAEKKEKEKKKLWKNEQWRRKDRQKEWSQNRMLHEKNIQRFGASHRRPYPKWEICAWFFTWSALFLLCALILLIECHDFISTVWLCL